MPKQRHMPIRSCVVCRQTSDKRALLRVARLPEKEGGQVVADPTGKRAGRGAYVCPDEACIDKAQKQHRFERALSAKETVAAEVFETLKTLSNARQPSAVAQSETRSEEPMN